MDVVLENNPELKPYVEFVNLGVASEESLDLIDAAFKTDKYPSIINADVDSAKYWINDDTKTLDLKTIGFDDSVLSNSYGFAKEHAEHDGQLKAVTFQSTAGSVFYNRAIAKDVWGTDDPAEIQNKIKDWDSFFAAAEELKAKGYKIVSSPQEIYYAVTRSLRKDAWVQDGKFKADDSIKSYIEYAKKLADGDYTNMVNMWDGSWFTNMADGGNVFCYFACPWMVSVFTGNGATNGSWGTTVGPANYYWGGSYVCAGKDTPNPELVAYLLYELTCDPEISIKIANKLGDCPNNIAANDRLVAGETAADNAALLLFGSNNNPFGTWAEAAKGLSMSAVTEFDKNYEDYIKKAADGYITGDYKSVDEAIQFVKDQSNTELGIPAAE